MKSIIYYVVNNVIMKTFSKKQLDEIREFILNDTALQVELSRILEIDELKDNLENIINIYK